MKTMVVGFSGKIGSGKSTLSKGVANSLGWPVISFGDYVRKEASKQGLGHERETLQELGALLASNPAGFCECLLSESNWTPDLSIVIDGIRHVSILSALRDLVHPATVFLVHVVVREEVRRLRMADRESGAFRNYSSIESHSTEVEVASNLHDVADLVVNGNRPKETLIEKIVGKIRKAQLLPK